VFQNQSQDTPLVAGHRLEDACLYLAPCLRLVGKPGWEINGQKSPLATDFHHVMQGVEQFPQWAVSLG
jgi:hypothetical protein